MNGGLIRPHQPKPGAALDRRILRELFMHAARRMNNIMPDSIADDQLTLEDFFGDTFEDYYFDYVFGASFTEPTSRVVIPGTLNKLNAIDGPVEANMIWSMDLVVTSQNAQTIVGWPVFGGKALWHANRRLQPGASNDYNTWAGPGNPDPIEDISAANIWVQGDRVHLSGEGSSVLGTGRWSTGVLLSGIGEFKIVKASVAVNRRAR